MKKLFFLIAVAFFTMNACEEDKSADPNKNITGSIEIYLLDDYTKGFYGEINEGSVVTKKTPLIEYSDIISYDKSTYTFKLSDDAQQVVQDLEVPLDGLAFAVMANDELIYTAYFWTPLSSMICYWTVSYSISYSLNENLELPIKLGYPADNGSIPDKRNDSRLLSILRNDGKLIE